MSGNGWLARQRKGDLVDIAESLGLKEYVLSIPSFLGVSRCFLVSSFALLCAHAPAHSSSHAPLHAHQGGVVGCIAALLSGDCLLGGDHGRGVVEAFASASHYVAWH